MTDEELTARLRDWQEHDEGKINDAREAAADRIKALTAKLTKAVEGLEDLVSDCEADYQPSHGAIKHFAIATLAEIKSGVATTPYGLEGESHE